MDTFADRLRAAMAAHDKKPGQADLARAAGVKSSSMAGWFGGATTPANVKALPLIKAAAYLGVRPQWLLEGLGPMRVYAPQHGEVREPELAWDAWPFPSIDRARFDRLKDRQKGLIEGYLLRMIEDAELVGKVRAA